MFAIPEIDSLSTEELALKFFAWLESEGEVAIDATTLDQAYNLAAPRICFLKSLPHGSKVLDLGAGDGSTAVFKEWPLFTRTDLRLFALSLSVGEHFWKYESFEIKNFEEDKNIFPEVTFDAAICAHFIEHISSLEASIDFLKRKMRPGGRIYLEWPHPTSKRMPTLTEVGKRGVQTSTINFFDDSTHIEAWEMESVLAQFERSGFVMESGGRVYLPWIAAQMRDQCRIEPDVSRMTLAAWSAFGWAQYLVLART